MNTYKAKIFQQNLYLDRWGNFDFKNFYNQHVLNEYLSNFVFARLNKSQHVYQISPVDVQGKSRTPEYKLEASGNIWRSFAFDQSPTIKFVTSNVQFTLDFQDFIWTNDPDGDYLKVEVTDLLLINQTWITVDHGKQALTVLGITDEVKSVLVSFPNYYIYTLLERLKFG